MKTARVLININDTYINCTTFVIINYVCGVDFQIAMLIASARYFVTDRHYCFCVHNSYTHVGI